jgi:hypothetical protein
VARYGATEFDYMYIEVLRGASVPLVLVDGRLVETGA